MAKQQIFRNIKYVEQWFSDFYMWGVGERRILAPVFGIYSSNPEGELEELVHVWGERAQCWTSIQPIVECYVRNLFTLQDIFTLTNIVQCVVLHCLPLCLTIYTFCSMTSITAEAPCPPLKGSDNKDFSGISNNTDNKGFILYNLAHICWLSFYWSRTYLVEIR